MNVVLAVDQHDQAFGFFGLYANLKAAQQAIESRLAQSPAGYTVTWREPLLGERLGLFANYTVQPHTDWVAEVHSETRDDFLIFVGTYAVQEEAR